jgi:hypothetical protein
MLNFPPPLANKKISPYIAARTFLPKAPQHQKKRFSSLKLYSHRALMMKHFFKNRLNFFRYEKPFPLPDKMRRFTTTCVSLSLSLKTLTSCRFQNRKRYYNYSPFGILTLFLFIFHLGLQPPLIAQEYFPCLSNPNTGCPPENPECGFEQPNAPCQNPAYNGVILFTGGVFPASEECERIEFPVHLPCTAFPPSCASNLLFHALEVKFRVAGDGIFEGVIPTYEVPVNSNTQQLTYFSYLNEREFKWIVLCYEQIGSVFQHQLPIGDLQNIIPLFHLNVLADPGAEISVEIEYANIIGIDYVNPGTCDDDCCAFPGNATGSIKNTPPDCTQNIVANLKQLNTPDPGEEIWYSLILENKSGAPINYNSLDFRLRFEDLHETIPDIGISFPGDLPAQKEENYDENGSAPGETGTFYYRFMNGTLPAGETAMLDIVILDPVAFENLLGEGNLSLEFVRLNTSAGCCQAGGLPVTEQVVFPGVLECENGLPVVRIGPLTNPPPGGECKTGFTVQFLSSGDMTVERLYMEFDIETTGVLAFSEIKPGANSLACMATCPGNCVAECNTNHIVIDFSDSGNPLLINNLDYFEIIFDGNNGSITGVSLTSLEFDQVNEDPCIPAVSFDPSLQFPIKKCDYCDQVTAEIGAYAGSYTLDDNCEEGFSVYMDFGTTLVDRLTVEFTLQVMGTGTVTINEQASTAFCDAYTNSCDPGAGASNCLGINGNMVTLDLCYASATAPGNNVRIIDLVLNGTGSVSGVTITKLEVHPCDPPNYNPCQGEVCDVRYLGAAAGVFPLVPTQNPSVCLDEWTIAGGIREETNLPNPPNCCGAGDGIGDVEVCITDASILPTSSPFNEVLCTNPFSSGMTSTVDCDGTYGQTFTANASLLYVTPIKDCAPLNGVSTFDLVLITKHILGAVPLNSPYKMIAADANHSNSVTTFDLVEIRKLILFINTDFPNNTSWRFIDAGYIFPDTGNPFVTQFPEEIIVTESQNPAMDVDFIGVKIGDVNNSAGLCDACGPGFAPPGNGGESVFLKIMNDGALKAGEVRTLEFAVQSEEDLTAWQTGIRFDPEVFEFLGTEASALAGFSEENNFGLTEAADGKIRVLWFAEDGSPLGFRSAEGIIRLRFKALENIEDVSRAMSLDDEVLQNLAYEESGRACRILLKANRTDEISSSPVREQLIVQAIPNPFKNEVIFSLHLPEESPVEITLFDIYGRLAATWQGSLDAGKATIPFSETSSWGSGVFIYMVKTPLQTLTGTVVKQ